ncbi:MAG: hypothetical protein U9N81_13805 [Bacillota bacterium]|nr:hypothetical protein [Bacillota bacterium]
MKRFITFFLLCWFFLTPLVNAAVVSPFTQGYIEGVLQAIILSPGNDFVAASYTARIESFDGGVFDLRIASDTVLIIDQLPARVTAFRPGMEIYGELRGYRLTSMESYSAVSMAAIKPESRVYTGIIRNIYPGQVDVELATGERCSWFIDTATLIERNNQSAEIGSLLIGDRVKGYFNEYDSNYLSRLQIMGESITIRELVRATFYHYDSLSDRLTMNNVQKMINGTWDAEKHTRTMQLLPGAQVYLGSRLIPASQLKNYSGREVYLTVRQVMGRDSVDKMIIKNQYESIFREHIAQINQYSETLEMSNQQNVTYHDGTIVIKDGRLVDKSVLQHPMDAVVVTDGRLSVAAANVISIMSEELNNTAGEYRIYYGALDLISEYDIYIEPHFMLVDNEWQSFSDEKHLYYSENTSLYDQTAGTYLSIEDFRIQSMKGRYAYLFTNGDQVIGLVIRSNDPLSTVPVSTGNYDQSIANQYGISGVSLSNVRNYTSRNRWVTSPSNMILNFNHCLIVKNGTVIQLSDLQQGDQLFVVRYGSDAKVVVVR